MVASTGKTPEFGFDISAFRDAVHQELGPMISSAMDRSRSPDVDHFRDKMDLRRLYVNLLGLIQDIAKEEVICRHKKKRTDRHVRLVRTAEDSFETLRQMAVVFNLSY